METTITTTSPDHSTRASSSRRRVASIASAIGVLGLATVALTGCSGIATALESAVGAEQVQQHHYDRYTDTPSSRDSTDVAWFMPDWVPTDATDIDVRLDTQEPGYEIAFTSTTGVDPSLCTPVEGDLGGPALAPTVLPSTLPTSGLLSCGDGRVTAEIDGQWFGWTTVEPVPGVDGGSTLRGGGDETPAS